MINFLLWIIVGLLVGVIASIIRIARSANADGQRSLLSIIAGVLLDLFVGVVGAFFAGLVITPLIGGGSIAEGGVSLSALLMALLGATVAVNVAGLVRRRSAR